jgi:membrane-associated phospholipid phosphatase
MNNSKITTAGRVLAFLIGAPLAVVIGASAVYVAVGTLVEVVWGGR